jgi:F-type H+-transporting ATPase subunit gamma
VTWKPRDMEEAARIKERIASLGELRNVIHAIRGIAAARIQEAQTALAGIRNYVDIVEDAIGEAASLAPGVEHVSLPLEAPPKPLLIAVCAEHGFVGGYNEALLDRAVELLEPGLQLAVIGRRGAAIAAERELPLAWQSAGTTYVRGVAAVARRIADRVAETSHATIVFARYRGAEGYAIEVRRVLPLDPALLVGAEKRVPPIHQLAPERLLRSLAGEYLFAELTRAIMEGLASENAARLSTMQAADHNIGDKLEALEKQERITRQERITVELLDVVTGAEALQAGRPR